MQNIVSKRLCNAPTFTQPTPFGTISLDDIPLHARVDNSSLNTRKKWALPPLVFVCTAPELGNFGTLA